MGKIINNFKDLFFKNPKLFTAYAVFIFFLSGLLIVVAFSAYNTYKLLDNYGGDFQSWADSSRFERTKVEISDSLIANLETVHKYHLGDSTMNSIASSIRNHLSTYITGPVDPVFPYKLFLVWFVFSISSVIGLILIVKSLLTLNVNLKIKEWQLQKLKLEISKFIKKREENE